MPYAERLAESYLQSIENTDKLRTLMNQSLTQPNTGVAGTGVTASGMAGTGVASTETTGSGTVAPLPKYRAPNKDEADQHIASTKSMTTGIATIAGVAVGGPSGALVGGGIQAASEHYGPKIENHIRNSEWVPVYENWDENDFHNAFAGR